MVEQRARRRQQKFDTVRAPRQARSRQRRDEILATTAALLGRVGFDDLTTILIAGELGISVGSLYHYFPNKQAILHALGERWLSAYEEALDRVASEPLETLSADGFASLYLEALRPVYREEEGVLPLVQAMFAVPELRDLDRRHDDMVIGRVAQFLARLGYNQSRGERRRMARIWLEMTHALLLTVSAQAGARARASLQDLHQLAVSYLAANKAP